MQNSSSRERTDAVRLFPGLIITPGDGHNVPSQLSPITSPITEHQLYDTDLLSHRMSAPGLTLSPHLLSHHQSSVSVSNNRLTPSPHLLSHQTSLVSSSRLMNLSAQTSIENAVDNKSFGGSHQKLADALCSKSRESLITSLMNDKSHVSQRCFRTFLGDNILKSQQSLSSFLSDQSSVNKKYLKNFLSNRMYDESQRLLTSHQEDGNQKSEAYLRNAVNERTLESQNSLKTSNYLSETSLTSFLNEKNFKTSETSFTNFLKEKNPRTSETSFTHFLKEKNPRTSPEKSQNNSPNLASPKPLASLCDLPLSPGRSRDALPGALLFWLIFHLESILLITLKLKGI